MVLCDYCKKPTDSLQHRCKYCGKFHCSKHLQPENHDCRKLPGLKDGPWRPRGPTSSPIDEEPTEVEPPVRLPTKKRDFSEKLKGYFLDKYEGIKYWLMKREHHKYDLEGRLNYLITNIMIFVASIVGVAVFYSNAQKLNLINLWIIKLGGVLILISLFFAIKFGWRLIEEIINIFQRQKNWFRYLVMILIIISLWQGYNHKNDVLNPIFDYYNKINFKLLSPIQISNLGLNAQNNGISFDYNDKDGNKKTADIKVTSPIQKGIDIGLLEIEIHNLINNERRNNGLTALSLDSKLSDIARVHSQDMAQNNFFAHENLRGQDPTARASAQGYSCYKSYGSYYTSGIAENIFQNNLYTSTTSINFIPFHDWSTQSEIAESTVQGWMNSPGHRQNILTSTYDKEGIGVAIASDDKVYITEDFC